MRSAAASTIADACCVLIFVIIGRHAHGHGETVAGVWQTAWPFLAGLAAGLIAVRAWRQPAAIRPAGVGAWIGAAGAGMLFRVLAGQGTALAFIGVTFAFLGVFLLGWRAVVAIVGRRRHPHPAGGR